MLHVIISLLVTGGLPVDITLAAVPLGYLFTNTITTVTSMVRWIVPIIKLSLTIAIPVSVVRAQDTYNYTADDSSTEPTTTTAAAF
jgi:hypothetical protein